MQYPRLFYLLPIDLCSDPFPAPREKPLSINKGI